jgi:hypothetical protein
MVYYLDLDSRLPNGVAIESASASTGDLFLEIDSVQVVEDDIIISGAGTCAQKTLPAGRAILIRLSGGQSSDEEVTVVASWSQSDGNTDAVNCRLLIGG